MEHHYLLTEDIPELKGRQHEIVNTTDYAGEIYMRQERGGALIGTYEPHGVVWSPVKTPDDFQMQLLPENASFGVNVRSTKAGTTTTILPSLYCAISCALRPPGAGRSTSSGKMIARA